MSGRKQPRGDNGATGACGAGERVPAPLAAARNRGKVAAMTGRFAEDTVLRAYEEAGCLLAARRWRGCAGELDLVLDGPEGVIFVEVKAARSLARAAERLGAAQIRRLIATAEEFLGTRPGGSLTPCRFDVALVDRSGRVARHENALWA